MNKFSLLLLVIISLVSACKNQKAYEVNLKYEENITPYYDEIIDHYQKLAKSSPYAKLIEIGSTDVGEPLHLLILSKDKIFNPTKAKEKNLPVILVNNGIHAGEPCGIDASLQFASDVLNNKDEKLQLIDQAIVCIVPVLSIGGHKVMSPYFRVNQNGPLEHGFRANAKNYDLNRDFIKMDSKNIQSFVKTFHEWDPLIFIDTHTSNGADYQYVMTLITTHEENLSPQIAELLEADFKPYLFEEMKKGGYEMTPYVYPYFATPDNGIEGFVDPPRNSSGFAGLFNTIGFTTETHMFKSYKDRVLSSYNFIVYAIEYVQKNSSELIQRKHDANKELLLQKEFAIGWKIDSTQVKQLNFKGYKAEFIPSKLTGLNRLKYNRNQPWEKEIPYYNKFKVSKVIAKPKYYIVPQAWYEIIEKLKLNQVEMTRLKKDSLVFVHSYYIDEFSSPKQPYNGHYRHEELTLRSKNEKIQYYEGDYIIPTNQSSIKLIINALEPEATDSYFRWNFFDSRLSRIEYFSAYIFEETAIQILEENKELKEAFLKKQKEDKAFANNHYLQLKFIYDRSPYSEPMYRRYPVARIEF